VVDKKIVHGGGIIISLAATAIAIAIIVVMQTACRTPPDVRPFPPFPEYTEKFADPDVVDEACYTPGGRNDEGRLLKIEDRFCGCVDHVTKTVWIARRIACDLDAVRAHEAFHIKNKHLRGKAREESRKECARRFPARVY